MDRFTRIASYIPDWFDPVNNPNWSAILNAMAEQHEELDTALVNAKEQLFIKTAVSKFLDYLASNLGVSRPTIAYFVDNKFRELIPILSYYPKQVKPSIYKCLELFWSTEYLHSTVTSTNFETFNLVGGETLTLTVDETHDVAVNFLSTDFAVPGAATAEEVAARINTWLPEYVIAYTDYDHLTSQTYVKLSTQTFGLAGAIQVTGGTANAVLGFPTDKKQYTKVSLHELHPNELVVRIPKKIPLELDTLKWSHRFHPDATIIDGRPTVSSANPYWPGSFFYDRTDYLGSQSVKLSSISTVLQTAIVPGPYAGVINVLNSSQFPNSSGQVVFGFGSRRQEVVKYSARLSNTSLTLDFFNFQFLHSVGETINLCNFPLPTSPAYPRVNGSDYAIYFNNTEISRQLMQEFVLLLRAAGIICRWEYSEL